MSADPRVETIRQALALGHRTTDLWLQAEAALDSLAADLEQKTEALTRIEDDNYLLNRADDWRRLTERHIRLARAALRADRQGQT